MPETENAPYTVNPQYLEAVGGATLAWNSLEIPIEAICAILHRLGGGNELSGRRRMPRAFQDKIEFLRECSSELEQLQALIADFDHVLTRSDTLASVRNHLVHGIPDMWLPVPPGVVVVFKTELVNNVLTVVRTNTSIPEIVQFSDKVLALGHEARTLLFKVARAHNLPDAPGAEECYF